MLLHNSLSQLLGSCCGPLRGLLWPRKRLLGLHKALNAPFRDLLWLHAALRTPFRDIQGFSEAFKTPFRDIQGFSEPLKKPTRDIPAVKIIQNNAFSVFRVLSRPQEQNRYPDINTFENIFFVFLESWPAPTNRIATHRSKTLKIAFLVF